MSAAALVFLARRRRDPGRAVLEQQRPLPGVLCRVPPSKLRPDLTGVLPLSMFAKSSAGIPESVLSRAREVAGLEDRGEPIKPTGDGRQGAGPLTLESPKVRHVGPDIRPPLTTEKSPGCP